MGERHQRAREIFLVDRHAEIIPIPGSSGVEQQELADRGVHQPDLLRRADAAAARPETARCHHVDHHLRGLEQTAVRPLRQVARPIQDLDAFARGVGAGQRVAAQDQDDLRPMFGEELLARLHVG